MSQRIERAHEWHLVRRPRGSTEADDFAMVEVPVPPPASGQVVVQNTHLSVDPYMRGRMDDKASYIDPFPLNAALEGGAIGVVVESRADSVEPGDVVEHFLGLRDVTVTDAANVSRIELDGLPSEVFLGVLGATGLTAWLGMVDVAPVTAGDTVLVTGAAGAVGSTAGQIAKLRGAGRVIGSAGTGPKAKRLVEELGFDAAFDYNEGDYATHLSKLAPDGLDVVFDNVGGNQLEAAIGHLRVGARIALCGMASQYDARRPHGPRNLFELIAKRATARGFIVSDHYDRMPSFRREVQAWVQAGKVQHSETLVNGLEQVPEVLRRILSTGTSIVGKSVVQI